MGEPAAQPRVAGERRRRQLDEGAGPPHPLPAFDERVPQPRRQADRVVRCAREPRERVHQDQTGDALRVGRRHEHRHRPALGVTDDRRLPAAQRIEDDPRVVHPALEGGQPLERHRVGDPAASLVEDDDARERSETVEVGGDRRLLPHHLDVAGPVLDEQQVTRAAAQHLVGDRPLSSRDVSRLRLIVHGQTIPCRCLRARGPRRLGPDATAGSPRPAAAPPCPIVCPIVPWVRGRGAESFARRRVRAPQRGWPPESP